MGLIEKNTPYEFYHEKIEFPEDFPQNIKIEYTWFMI